jgi:NAD-dependent SIR2 family protein deacetylase
MNGMDHAQLNRLTDLVAEGDVVVRSGAGLSTESGIPDYRGPTGTAQHGRRRPLPSDLAKEP